MICLSQRNRIISVNCSVFLIFPKIEIQSLKLKYQRELSTITVNPGVSWILYNFYFIRGFAHKLSDRIYTVVVLKCHLQKQRFFNVFSTTFFSKIGFPKAHSF